MAVTYNRLGRFADAEPLQRRALAITRQLFGSDHPRVAQDLNNLAATYSGLGRPAEAEALLRQAVGIWEKQLGAENSEEAANALFNLAQLELSEGNVTEALAWSRKATQAAQHQLERNSGAIRELDVGTVRNIFEFDLEVLRRAALQKLVGREAEAEAFEVAQWEVQSTTAAALNQMATRFRGGTDALAALIREQQDVTSQLKESDQKLLLEIAKPQSQRDGSRQALLEHRSAELKQLLQQLNARLAREFPDYARLANPKPLGLAAAQKLLGEDEALIFILNGIQQTFVFAVTRADHAWHAVGLGGDGLAAKVGDFRRGLDVNEWEAARQAGTPVMFDLGLAHQLYSLLLGPVEPLILKKARLIIVPTGALTALPFHLLVTAPPEQSVPADLAGYRDASWLIRRQAISMLPAIITLQGLRTVARGHHAAKPMVGFGDPVFALASTTPAARSASRSAIPAKTRAYSEYWRGAGVDRQLLAQALPALPDTGDELKAVAARIGAPESDLHLGADANERVVKTARLADYRVVYFATHGLVAGDIKGLAEPSLALTLPKVPSEQDDGLLTASEIAQLKLNADWVVLSACNTAAGNRPGAEALSGLARAFFYAGARALLVSHWAVASNAATAITTATFAAIASNPDIGRAEALRRAMLAYLENGSDPQNAYPAFWAPFAIVGEGAAQ